MTQPNHDQYEIQYRYLRENGFPGWGGESFDRRMEGWKETIRSLLHFDGFPKRGAKILEIGSGAGDSLIPLAENGFQVTGIDISPTAVEWAREKFAAKNLSSQFLLGDITKCLPFADASFDAVLDAACLHCIIGEDRRRAMHEIYRVLRPKGFFLVSHMVNDPRELSPGVIFNPRGRTQERKGLPYRSMPTYDQLVEEIKPNGFEIIQKGVRQNNWWDHAELWCLKI